MTHAAPSVADTLSVDGRLAPPPRPRPHRPPRPVIAVVLLLLAGGAYWLLRPQPSSGPLTASGTVEVDEVMLSAQASGRIAELSVDEGSSVLEGQLIGR